jgi:hypothetical protein
MAREYVDGQGIHCPCCHGTDIEAGEFEADGASAWSQVTYMECGAEWQDVFFLSAVETVEERGRYRETIMPAARGQAGGPENAAAITGPQDVADA